MPKFWLFAVYNVINLQEEANCQLSSLLNSRKYFPYSSKCTPNAAEGIGKTIKKGWPIIMRIDVSGWWYLYANFLIFWKKKITSQTNMSGKNITPVLLKWKDFNLMDWYFDPSVVVETSVSFRSRHEGSRFSWKAACNSYLPRLLKTVDTIVNMSKTSLLTWCISTYA